MMTQAALQSEVGSWGPTFIAIAAVAAILIAVPFVMPLISNAFLYPVSNKGDIAASSQRHGVDPYLVCAIIRCESGWDADAYSEAGAEGLMQIMPATADHLGLSRDLLYDPEQNIAAATRYLAELERDLATVHDREERRALVLACYNGGPHHIRDAMRLAERDGRDPHSWPCVREYVLRLSQPRYYQDTLVHHGYMRGQETADYVDKIRQRYQQYRHSAK